jgi:hypothetical protein
LSLRTFTSVLPYSFPIHSIFPFVIAHLIS